MTLEGGFNVLQHPHHAGASHVLIRFAVQIIGDTFRYRLGQTGPGGWLEQRELVKFVVFIVDHSEAFDFGMGLEPCDHLVATRPMRHIRNDVYEGDAPMLGAE